MLRVDVAVVGGGVTGLASALALADAARRCACSSAKARPGRATSTHNCGVIHAGLYYPAGSLKARLCVEGRDRLYDFCATHRVPHARCGKLVVAADDHEVAELEALRAKAHANGVTRWTSSTRIHRAPRSRTCARWPRCGRPTPASSKPKRWSRRSSICAASATSRSWSAARSSAPRRTPTASSSPRPHERFLAGTVVNAAGLYADTIVADARRARVSHLPVPRRIRGARAVAATMVNGLVYPLPHASGAGLGVHLAKTTWGR